MGATIFIGDELTAAGFRLTGVETMTPGPDAVQQALRDARQRAALVIITASFSLRLPSPELEAALLAEEPIVTVVSDVLSRVRPPDLARRLRIALGIEI